MTSELQHAAAWPTDEPTDRPAAEPGASLEEHRPAVDSPNRLAGLPLFAAPPAAAARASAGTPPLAGRPLDNPVAPAAGHGGGSLESRGSGADGLARDLAAQRGGLAQPGRPGGDGLARDRAGQLGGLAQPDRPGGDGLARDRAGQLDGLAQPDRPGGDGLARDSAGQLGGLAQPGRPGGDGLARVPGPVDWAQVRAFRQQAAELLTAQLRDRVGLDEPARREIGRALIVAMLRDHADTLLAEGGQPPTPAAEHALAGAVFDALFGLGRLQSLVDRADVENVEITGCDPVYLDYGDGRGEWVAPVADSDEELIETLAFLAARAGGLSGSGERSFSPASPMLDLTLPGGARLAARAWNSHRPVVVIRRHRFTDIDLAGLRELGMLDDALVAFLSAAVRANKTIVVSGAQGAGKTTLVRALCNELDPAERIGTIETEYELLLHHLPHRHRRIVALEARPGTGERTTDGRPAGEITLDDLLYSSLRLNLSRTVVGEVRGREILPMIKAAQAGAGTLSTTHAHDARAAIERLVTCALEAGPHVTQEYAYLQIAAHIDLIVHVELRSDGGRSGAVGAGGKERYVSEVIEVARGEGGRPAITDVFAPGPDRRAVPRTRPSFLADLTQVGFDPGWLDHPAGSWQPGGAR